RALDARLPARQPLVAGLRALELLRGREARQQLAVQRVARADRDLIEVAEHVEAGEGDLRRALPLATVARGHRVEPADAARAARRGAELARVPPAAAQLVR